MVNVKNLFGMAVMATALVGCASNDEVTPNANEGNQTGAAYASFKINLPTTSGTRAADDGKPSFDGGDANEYAVKDATLLLFKQETEAGKIVYKFQEAVDLGNMEPWTKKDPANKGITTTAKMTAKLTKASVGSSDYYALILLNNNKSTAAKITYPSENQEFSEWSKKETNATAANYLKYDNGFFMANAPKYVANGEPQTLVQISAIYASKQEAENSTATTVYVERGLAKVSLASGSDDKHVDISGGNYDGDKVDIKGWTLDVTNTKTYPVHVTEGLSTDFTGIWSDKTSAGKNGATVARFYDSNLTEFPRVYWGVDPNYKTDFSDVTACGKEFKMATTSDFKTGADAKKAQYCLENTFDIKHMVQGQTTRVLFSAKYTPKGFSADETFYKMGNSSQLWNAAKVEAQIIAKAQEVLGVASNVTVKLNAASNDLTAAGTRLVKAVNVQYNSSDIKEDQAKKINEKLGFKEATATDPLVGLSTYAGGVSYYIARVKHFNELTKWNAGDATYNSSNIDWLGRYGVLRNNWYELTVNSVSGPGYPDIPEVKPTTPDDENDQYINVEVKILDWAKRSQTVDL